MVESTSRVRRVASVLLVSVLAVGCGNNSADDAEGSGGDANRPGSVGGSSSAKGSTEPPAPGACGSVRMTQYGASDFGGGCAFDRTHASLPDFVRQGMTIAIAEPYLGGSYGGEPGEACGECWEIDTLFATQLVMVHDICPIEGNPICAGSHFHFDVSNETAEALGGGWLGEAAVRQVPCPVTGNIQLRVQNRNQWGYVQLAFFNHRLPIRSVEYRAADGNGWTPLERQIGRWGAGDTSAPFSDDGPGVVFRITSADERVDPVESDLFPYSVGSDEVFDTGVQFGQVQVEGGACEFVPPTSVYDEGFGGIDAVRWESNTWGDTFLTEVSEGCADSSASCLSLTSFADSGVHLTYRSPFPRDTFSTLSLRVRAQPGGGTIQVAPRSEDSRCSNASTIEVSSDWTEVEIELGSACPDATVLQGLTISFASEPMDLMLDEIRFE